MHSNTKSIAVAQGVILILLNTFGNLTVDTTTPTLAVGLTSLAIAELQKEE